MQNEKMFENKIVRKSIVWAMTFMMAFSSVGGSMTVYATEAPTEGEINSGLDFCVHLSMM